MKTMKRAVVLGSASLFAAALPLAAADTVNLRFSAFVGERNPIFACAMLPLVNELEANTGTKVTVERYFGGAGFGAAEAQYDQVSRGITDMAFGMLTYKDGEFPLSEIISMPFMAPDHEKGTRILNEVIAPKYLGKELQDVKVMSLWMTSPYQFHMRSEVGDLTDMKGTRIRTAGTVQVSALEKLGVQVAAFPAPATYENLQKGVIDGTTATWTTATAFKVGEVAKYTYEVNFGGAVGFTAINPDSYTALPEDVKAIIDRYTGIEASVKVAKCFTEVDGNSRSHWLSQGNKAIALDSAQISALKERVAPALDAYLAQTEARSLPALEVRDAILAAQR